MRRILLGLGFATAMSLGQSAFADQAAPAPSPAPQPAPPPPPPSPVTYPTQTTDAAPSCSIASFSRHASSFPALALGATVASLLFLRRRKRTV